MNETKSHFARNLIVTGLIAAGLATAGYFYVKHQEEYPSTDDAYVHANIVYVAPQVSGKVISSNVTDCACCFGNAANQSRKYGRIHGSLEQSSTTKR